MLLYKAMFLVKPGKDHKIDRPYKHQDNATKKAENSPFVFNTISVPVGGQYQLILADGSHVWLNSASSLRFPAAFTAKDRKVALNGEAYFEVAKDASKPFIVETGSMQVRVSRYAF